jgi:hypothetical protein
VSEAVKLRSDLAEFAADKFVMIDRLVAAGNLERCGIRRL